MQVANPWKHDNKELLSMYAGATEGGECPLVVDSSTPSCGSSRFGCWVCTLVESDKSMTAMVQNDSEKEWMAPLLKLRAMIDFRRKGPQGEDSDKHLRDFRRLTGAVQLFHGDPIHGPYIQTTRQEWLREVLKVQAWIKQNSPPEVRGVELLSLGELEEIRRLWVMEKHEIEDTLPRIYHEATGEEYPGRRLDDNLVLGAAEMTLLGELCGDDRLHYELTRELLSVERQHRSQGRRAGLYERLDKTFKKHFFSDKADATDYARRRLGEREAAKAGAMAPVGSGADESEFPEQEDAS
jgi:DNA sulfur modification protein DndC